MRFQELLKLIYTEDNSVEDLGSVWVLKSDFQAVPKFKFSTWTAFKVDQYESNGLWSNN